MFNEMVYEKVAEVAQRAAEHAAAAVFCPPIAAFRSPDAATEANIANGLVLTVDCDKDPIQARKKLEALLGKPTMAVHSGGYWTNPDTGELEEKLHLHWRLSEPTRTPEDHAKLKLSRQYAVQLVGGDATGAPVSHPFRWPGSWHKKKEPRLCRIIELNVDQEIHLNEALEKLEEVAGLHAAFSQADSDKKQDSAEWRETTDLITKILTAEEYHDPLVRLSMRLLKSGVSPSMAVLILRGFMKAVPDAKRDFKGEDHQPSRWQARYDDIPRIVNDGRAKIDAEAQAWLDPASIKTELLQVPVLHREMIPAPFCPWVSDVAFRMQCPPDMAAAAAIVMTGAVIGTGCGIRPKCKDDWLVVPNLYGGIVGRPSVLMKSPTLKEALKPLNRLEVEAKNAFTTAKRLHEVETEHAKAKREAIKKKMTSAIKDEEPDAVINSFKSKYAAVEDAVKPIWRRYRTNDATIEKLSELLNENPRGLLVFRDELTALLASWEKEGHEGDRAYFLEGWNGSGDHFTDRIGRGTIYTENMCLSVFGGIQPAKIQQYLYANRLTNDGMFQRFQVLVYPDEPQEWQLIDEYPDIISKNRAFDIIKALADMDFVKHGAIREEGEKIPYFRFSDEAQEVMNAWLTDLEKNKIRSNDDPIMIEHLGKYRKLMPALALIFHLIEIADGTASGAVSKRAAELAAAWCDYLEAHARRVYGLVNSLPMQAAYNLSRRIAKGEVPDRFTIRDIYRNQWSLLTDKEITQAACDILVGKNWLREVETPRSFQQRAKTEYLINPKVKKDKG